MTLVHKTIQVSSAQLNKTSSAQHSPTALSKVSFRPRPPQTLPTSSQQPPFPSAITTLLSLSVCYVHKVCPGSIQPCSMKNRDIYWRRYHKHCTEDNDTLVPFKVGTLQPHTVLPTSLPLCKTLCKILCWNYHQLPCHIFLNLISGLKCLSFQRLF